MIPKQAIEKAIEGGYSASWRTEHGTEVWMADKQRFYTEHEIALDPAFWVALEKSLHWYAGEWKQKSEDFCSTVLRDGSTEEWWNNVLK